MIEQITRSVHDRHRASVLHHQARRHHDRDCSLGPDNLFGAGMPGLATRMGSPDTSSPTCRVRRRLRGGLDDVHATVRADRKPS
jgi:hypothetical protein